MVVKLEEPSALFDLQHYAVIEIKGADALEFLSSQFTNDLKKLRQNFSSLATWCSIKGRVLYSFRIWRDQNSFILILPSVHTESFLKRLKMYILRAKVDPELLSDSCVSGLICKENIAPNPDYPQYDNEYVKLEDRTFIKLPAPVSRYLIITTAKKSQTGTHESTTDLNQWQRLDIMAGIPEILPETSDKFLPQMLNMEHLGGLSFQKGCYPGQEIVARVKYRGELKKQLYKAVITTTCKVVPGMTLVSDLNDQETSVGTIINVANFGNDRFLILVVMTISCINNPDIILKDDPHSVFSVLTEQ